MKYAIVDIETTGGHANANGITEIAIIIHNGDVITEQYETLINPGVTIPPYIMALTGITNDMLVDAPPFAAVAEKIFYLLHDKIFVAHNVNFDYSFIKYHLGLSGYNLQCKKLCTVRLGRKIFPGLLSYSLGKFCASLDIRIENRHRAGGDAEATAILFSKLLCHDADGHIPLALSKMSKEQSLPPNLCRQQIERLPNTPGVYYFLNQKGKVIYVGKAKNIKKRVCSHFNNNNPGRQKQQFLKNIYNVSFEECGTELMAFVLEAVEIKRLWPEFNRSQKHFEHSFGFYVYEDQKGYLRVAIDKRRKYTTPAFTFGNLTEGYSILKKLIEQFELCPKLCFIQKNDLECTGLRRQNCGCTGVENAATYNTRVIEAVNNLKSSMPTYALFDAGRNAEEKSCLLIEQGKFYGMGYIHSDVQVTDIDMLKNYLKVYPSNDYIKHMIYQHADRFPHKTFAISAG